MAENMTSATGSVPQTQISPVTQAGTLAAPAAKQSLYGEGLLSHPLSGWVVPAVLGILLLYSIATWASLLVKGWQFSRFARHNKRFAKRFWAASSLEEGEAIARQSRSALARIVQKGADALTGSDAPFAGKTLSRQINRAERLERGLGQQIQLERRHLEGGLALLASIGSTAPFIGLFGTVWGIMEALVHIGATGQASLDTVAGPIGHALIATGIGIAAAVPAVLIYNFFIRRLKLASADLESFADTLFGLVQENHLADEKTAPESGAVPIGGRNIQRLAGSQS